MPRIALFLLFAVAVLAAGPGRAVAQADPLSATDKRLYKAAFAAVETERWTEARRLAAQAADPLPAKVVDWLDLTRPGAQRSFEDYARFLRENPDWPGQRALRAEAERAMSEGLPAATVIEWFGDRPPATIAGAMKLAAALLRNGREADATALVRDGWVRLDAAAGEEIDFLLRHKRRLRAEDHLARLDRLLWDGQSGPARRMMKRVDAGHRALAEARLRLMRLDPGVDGAVRQVPRELLRDPGLIYERARWRRRKEMYEAVPELFEPPPASAGHTDVLWFERHDAARRALARGETALAYRLARDHGAERGLTFAEGEWLAGWVALRFRGDAKTAHAHFKRLYEGVDSALSSSRGAYWAGRAAETLGEAALAAHWYETAATHSTAYYGQLAAQRLGRDEALRLPAPAEPTAAARAAFAELELTRVVRALGALDQTDQARPFLIRLTEIVDGAGGQRMVGDLAAELGRPDLTVVVAKAARQRGAELVEFLFPLRAVPDGDGPEDALVLAVVKQESAFAADAVSPAGARGLMQLMPATAKQVAGQIRLKYDKAKLTADPDFNMRLGRAYLDDLLRRFDGSYVLAVAAYNAGPSRVWQWIRELGDPRDERVDTIDWVESIPFGETRNYVQRVMENLQVYRHRLDRRQVALSLEQDLSRKGRP